MPAASETPLDAVRSVSERFARVYDRSQWISEVVLLPRLTRNTISRARCLGQFQLARLASPTD